MWAFLCFVFWAFLPCFHGSPCQSLDGVWYNQLGSEMTVLSHEDGRLVGEYRTAVERNPGAAGGSFSVLQGVTASSSPVFGFSVIWRSGNSTTSWLGQCARCGDEEMLMTTWILQLTAPTYLDTWKSTIIGQDIFTRNQHETGPRKQDDTHAPVRNSIWIKNQLRKLRNSATQTVSHPCKLNRTWYDKDGSTLTFDDSLNGKYTSADGQLVEAAVHGYSIGKDFNSVFAFQIVQHNDPEIIVFTAQCHRSTETGGIFLETSLLKRSTLTSCYQKEYDAKVGKTRFTRTRPKDTLTKGSWLSRAMKSAYSYLFG